MVSHFKFSHHANQRWSRGHKARGQGQGHKKNPRPRPRTAFTRTEPLEAKDRNARGQGQGPMTQAQVFSQKKKRSSKIFFRRSSIHWRTQNFWLGWGQHLNCRGDASPHRDLASPQRDLSAGWSDEKDLILHQILAKNRFNFRRRPFFLVFT